MYEFCEAIGEFVDKNKLVSKLVYNVIITKRHLKLEWNLRNIKRVKGNSIFF